MKMNSENRSNQPIDEVTPTGVIELTNNVTATADNQAEVVKTTHTSKEYEEMGLETLDITPTMQDSEDGQESTKVSEELTTVESTIEVQIVDFLTLDVEALYGLLNQMVEKGELPEAQAMKHLKHLVYDLPVTDSQTDEEIALYDEEDNGEERDNDNDLSPKSELLARYINLKTRYHELSAQKQEKEKAEKEENLLKKEVLIQRLERSLQSTDDFFTVRNEFRNIREEWQKLGAVPENKKSDLLDRYSKLLDKFYEQDRFEKEAQEYDFAHNRKEKEKLIERAKALTEESDILFAFKELQKLHDAWRETGPVAQEFREVLWKEFKDISTIINKRHDDHFKQRHEIQLKNLEEKKSVVEELENLLITLPTTRDAWRNYERVMDNIRKKWKEIGHVPRASMSEITARFRVAADEFYLQRRNFMRELSEEITPKLERMRTLVSEAEELQDSTDWKVSTKRLQDMQKEWTSISKLGTRVAESQRLWRRFRSACDHFFQRKSTEHQQRSNSREENYTAKDEITKQLETLAAVKPEGWEIEFKRLQEAWKEIGPVPNSKKDELLDRYYSSVRVLTGKGDTTRRNEGAKWSNDGSDNKKRNKQKEHGAQRNNGATNRRLVESDEQTIIKRNITRMEDELRQYENNIGFFQASPDNPLVQQVQKKIDRIKERIEKEVARLTKLQQEQKEAKIQEDSLVEDPAIQTEETINIPTTESETTEE